MERFLRYSLAWMLILAPCFAQDQEKAIQASSSLLHYVDSTLQQIDCVLEALPLPQENISFTKQDLDSLWAKLDKRDPHAREAEAALQAAGHSENLLEGRADLRRAWLHLTTHWLQLNAYDPLPTIKRKLTNAEKNPKKVHSQQDRALISEFLNKKTKKVLPNQPHLTLDMRKRIKPYVLPASHALKPALDAIFTKQRPTHSEKTMKEAGFHILFSKPRSYIRVVRHPKLPDHLLKVYLDTELRIKRHTPGWKWLVNRCKGARQTRHAITQCKSRFFQAPHKWLYLLPNQPPPSRGIIPQPVLLVVEDMLLVSWNKNLNAWKEMQPKHLDELYRIISRAGGSSFRPDNIWLSTNGKFSFIDTEYPERKANYSSVRTYLAPQMRSYWDKLIKQGGPAK